MYIFENHQVVLYKGFDPAKVLEDAAPPAAPTEEEVQAVDIKRLCFGCGGGCARVACRQFVERVHNGIEYGDMQVLAEAYSLLKDVLKLSHDEMGQIFDECNNDVLDSFLIEITRNILKFKHTDGCPLVEKNRDAADQVGVGQGLH